MMASRGMGAINPRKMPTKKVIHRTDNPDDVDMYKEGGGVNAAGNYTKPGMRKSLFNSIKNSATQGTAAGQWSARKAPMRRESFKKTF